MDQKWVTFMIGQDLYAFELEHVQEMTHLPQCRHVPRMPQDQLGVSMLRNKIIPVYDLARTLGHEGAEQRENEVAQILKDRKQDHINWLDELESSIRERREFKLQLDPTKCKFGIWYAGFHTEDPWLNALLRRMVIPHAKIHALGKSATEHLAQGEDHIALDMISQHRGTTLHFLLELFDQAIQQVSLSSRRILIVLRGRSGPHGVAVDGLQSVASINNDDIQCPDNLPGHEQFDGLIGFWISKQTGKTVRLMDPVSLYPQLTAAHELA